MLRYSRFWWMVVLRGVLLSLLGAAALRWPGATLAVLVLWIGAGFLVNGVIALVAALAGRDVEGDAWADGLDDAVHAVAAAGREVDGDQSDGVPERERRGDRISGLRKDADVKPGPIVGAGEEPG